MNVIPTDIEGVLIIEPQVFQDRPAFTAYGGKIQATRCAGGR